MIVTSPVDKLVIQKLCPSVRVDVTGNVTVCVVEPVKYWSDALATVNIVFQAAVAVVAYHSSKLFIVVLALVSLVTIVLAVAALDTAVPVGKALNTGAVENVLAQVIVSVLSKYTISQSVTAVLNCALVPVIPTILV